MAYLRNPSHSATGDMPDYGAAAVTSYLQKPWWVPFPQESDRAAAQKRRRRRRSTPLMWDLPTPVNMPPAMAGFTDDPRSFAFFGAAAIVAYLLFRRK